MKFRKSIFLSINKKYNLHGYQESIDYVKNYLEDSK
jgi:hypothetical protein